MSEPAKVDTRKGLAYLSDGKPITSMQQALRRIRALEKQVTKYRTVHVLCGGCGTTYTYLRDAETGEEHECEATRAIRRRDDR